jgi:cholesterol transport system auxiliary component
MTAGDRILTVNGQQVAYIAEARWAAPAVILFDQALSRAFDDSGGPARLVGRGQAGNSQYVLQLDVRDFAAVYEAGPDSAPVVLVRMRASLTRQGDRTLIAEQTFESKVQTSDNRISAIAAGFEKAVAEMMGKLVAWTNASGKSV